MPKEIRKTTITLEKHIQKALSIQKRTANSIPREEGKKKRDKNDAKY